MKLKAYESYDASRLFPPDSVVLLLQAQEREEPPLETEAPGAGESGAEGRRQGRRPRRTSGRLRQGPGDALCYDKDL